MMDSQRAKQLLEKYLDGTCSPEERMIFESWYNKEAENRGDKPDSVDYIELEARIYSRLPGSEPFKIVALKWAASVAAAIALVVCGIYFIKNFDPVKHLSDNSTYVNDVPPGGNNATLTLANGKTINLNDAKSGIVVKASQLMYNDGTTIEGINVRGNEISTISTPRGGQYTIELPDGTTVTLNAASSLKFPDSFAGLVNRKVELAGEGYFQVAKDKHHPFIVISKDQEVKVLGTEFNINAYPEEVTIKTTLLEGLVAVNNQIILKPGQQSISNARDVQIVKADLEMETAWKKGQFIFDGQDFKTIINNISRWYDVDINYDPALADLHLGGQISRSRNLAGVLKMLEGTGDVKFKIEGRRISVIK